MRTINRRRLLSVVGAGLAALAGGCEEGGEDVAKRIRIIASALVDNEIVQGSTVMEIIWQPRGSQMHISTAGEALVLELAGRGTVYVLPLSLSDSGSFGGSWAGGILRTFGFPGQGVRDNLPALREAKGRYPEKGLGGPSVRPLIVAFRDESRKDSVFQVRPQDFEKVFGKGVKFIGIEFEFTDDPVTEVLANRLPMLVANDPKNVFPRDPAGKLRPFVSLPFPYKMSERVFFWRHSRPRLPSLSL